MNESIDILVKLFDTLKDAIDEDRKTSQELIKQQQDLVSHVKNLPVIELKKALKDHAEKSTQEIDSCTETVETKTDNILEFVRKIDNKVSKMIFVVAVAFTILSASYVLVQSVSNTNHLELKNELIELIELKHTKP